MLMYFALALLVAVIGLVGFWYVQTRNVEIARYEVLQADGAIELRAYPPLLVAEVTRTGTRDQAVRAGFGPLARYIFAQERGGEKIAMTAPVTQTAEGGSWTVRFIMPSGYSLDRCEAHRTPRSPPRRHPLQRLVVRPAVYREECGVAGMDGETRALAGWRAHLRLLQRSLHARLPAAERDSV